MTTPQTPAPTPAPATPVPLRDLLRQSLAGVLLLAGVLFALAALYPVIKGQPLKENWAPLTWGGVMAVVSLAAGGLILAGKRDPESDDLAALRQITALACLALAAGFAAVPVYLIVLKTVNVAIGPLFLWAGALAAGLLAFGLIFLLDPDWRATPLDRFRATVVGLSGVVGLLTLTFGVLLALTTYREDLARGLVRWRENPLALVLPGAAMLGSLVLMFLALQLVRDMERASAGMRRLVYGYNAALTIILLVTVLGLVNVLAYASPFDRVLYRKTDWTQSRFHSLADKTKQVISRLDESVKVTILLPKDSSDANDVRAMLDEARALTDKLTYEQVDLVSPNNEGKIKDIQEKYGLTSPLGLLVTLGGEGKGDHEFIRRDQLRIRPEMNPMNPEQPTGGDKFNGENALVNALENLTSGSVKLYFTQGFGEAELNPKGARTAPEASLRTLQSRLTERKNVKVEELRLGLGGVKKVPDDADIVIVVRPTQTYTPEAVGALRDYLKGGKGKLLALLEPIVQVEGTRKLVKSGLEPMLAEFGVQVGEDLVLTARRPGNPTLIQVGANANATSSVAKSFARVRFPLNPTQTVDEPRNPQPGAPYQVESLLLAPAQQIIWGEKNFAKEPTALVESLLRDQEQLAKTFSREDLSVAVTVSQSGGGGMPRDRPHAGLGKDKPLMVVYGSGSWATDKTLTGSDGYAYFDLFSSSVAWLREKASQGQTVDAKERANYKWNVPEHNVTRLVLLPPALIILAVVVLGTGVWIVRRR